MKRVNKFISVLLAIILLMSANVTAFADTSGYSYYERGILTDGTNTAYYLIDKDSKVLYVTGDGNGVANTPDYADADSGPFAGRNDITKVVICDDILRIGDYVFANLKSVDTVIIRSNLLTEASVSEKAFINDTGIRDVQGNSSVLSLSSLVNAVKIGAGIATGDWLGVVRNVISGGSSALQGNGTMPQETVATIIDDYIYTGQEVYLGPQSELVAASEERNANPCYTSNHTFNHSYAESVKTEPGCESEGVMEHTCSVCGDKYETSIPATGHTYTSSVFTPATCTKKGIVEVYCERCSTYSYVAYPALGHKSVIDARVEPTCTTTGLTQGSHCSVCGEVLQEQEVIPTLSHNYEYFYNEESDSYTAVCSLCSDTITEFDNDLEALVAAVNSAKTFNEEDYTPESYARMVAAASPYYDLTVDSVLNYPQFAVDEKTSEILTEIAHLTPYLNFNLSSPMNGVTLTYNGDTYGKGHQRIAFGTQLTVTAPEKEGYIFKGWYENDTNKVFSTDSTYTFVLNSNMLLKALYVKEGDVSLTFANVEGQLYNTVTMTAEEWEGVTSLAEYIPRVPFRYGYTNGRWDCYDGKEQEILAALRAGNDYVVNPVYDELAVNLPRRPSSVDGLTPALAMLYQFSIDSNTKTYVASLAMAGDIPENTQIEEIGIAYYRGKPDVFSTKDFVLTIDNKMSTVKFDGVSDNGLYILSVSKFTATYNWAFRGYVTYYDEDGILRIAYSNQINIEKMQAK